MIIYKCSESREDEKQNHVLHCDENFHFLSIYAKDCLKGGGTKRKDPDLIPQDVTSYQGHPCLHRENSTFGEIRWKPLNDKWASWWDYGTYHIGDQWRLQQDCTSAQSSQSLRCLHTKYGSRRRVWPKIRHLAPLCGYLCTFEEWVYGGQKVP